MTINEIIRLLRHLTRHVHEETVIKLQIAIETLEQMSPCDLCQYNPPSSGDGKPCCMCPACARMVEPQKNEVEDGQ